MSRKSFVRLVSVAALAAVSGQAALADVIYKESVPFADVATWSAGSSLNANFWGASNFVTDAVTSGTYQINVNQGFVNAGTGNSNSVWVKIFSNSGPGGTTHYSGTGLNSPGSEILTLSGDSDPDSGVLGELQYYDYTGTITLAPNTNYWVVIGTASTTLDEYFPTFCRGTWPLPQVGARVEGMKFSPDHGGNWAFGNYWGLVNYDMTISVNAVPAPGACALVGIGGLCTLRRKRRTV